MAIANTDYFLHVGNPGTATTLASPGYTIGNTSITVASTTNFPTDTAVIFSIDTAVTTTGAQVRNTGSYCVYAGIVTGASTIGSLTLLYGTPQNYAASALTRVYITVSAFHHNRTIDGILQFANQDGTLKTAPVQAALGLGTTALNGWNALGFAPATVTYNGNRSYDLVFNGQDLTSTLSAGMRLRTTRTVAAPTQSTSLNGTTQYYSKTSPAGMTFTNGFVAGAWVKLSSYPTSAMIIQSRYNGTSGWELHIETTGQVQLDGYNGGSANYAKVSSYQSIPLNKWVHIAAQLDMTNTTNDGTNNYIMFDGANVPAVVTRGGTNPTALPTQVGNYEIGSWNGGLLPFKGSMAQAFVSSAKITQATIRTLISQGLTPALITANSIISAYSFDNSVNDLNTTNANNLTANGSAVATNPDSPFGTQASGSISSTLDYAIIQKASFSTNTTVTVQVPEGCTIPTSGGVSAVVYSSNAAPYGFPRQRGKWQIVTKYIAPEQVSFGATATWYASNFKLLVPVGEWVLGYQIHANLNSSVSGVRQGNFTVSDATPTNAVFTQDLTAFLFGATGTDAYGLLTKNAPYSAAAATTSTFYGSLGSATGTEVYKVRGDIGPCYITAENAYI